MDKRFFMMILSATVLLLTSCSKPEKQDVSSEAENLSSRVRLPVVKLKAEQVLQQAVVRELQQMDDSLKFSDAGRARPVLKDAKPRQADKELKRSSPLNLRFDHEPLKFSQFKLASGETHSLLPNLFNENKIKSDVSFRGRFLMDKEKKGYFEAVEGLEVSIDIKTY